MMSLVKLSATYASYIEFLGMHRMLMFCLLEASWYVETISGLLQTFSSNLHRHELRTVVADSL